MQQPQSINNAACINLHYLNLILEYKYGIFLSGFDYHCFKR